MKMNVMVFLLASCLLLAGTAMGQLGGDYYIPQGEYTQGFLDLYEAFEALENEELEGPVTIFIMDDINHGGGMFDVLPVLSNSSISEQNPLTIRPGPDATPTITLSGSPSIDIKNTSWVTIDGSNTENGTSRDMTLRVEHTGAAASGIIRILDDCQNIVIRNLIFENEELPSADGILIDREGTVSPNGIIIDNNLIGSMDHSFSAGVAIWGNSADLPVTNVQVSNNIIYAGRRAITTYYIKDQEYFGNTIIVNGQYASNIWHGGIYACGGYGYINIYNNKILGLAVTGTGYAGGILLNANEQADVYNNFIAMNMINARTDEGTNNNVYGLVINHPNGGEPVNIMHNTIYLPETGLTGRHAGIGWHRDTKEFTTAHIVNNIVINNNDLEESYGIHWPWNSGIEVSDFNNIYVSGADANFGFYHEEVCKTLDEWYDETFYDENSVSKSVSFLSDIDLSLTDEDMELSGTPIEWITTDIFGEDRSPTAPYMGAHEYSAIVSTKPIIEMPSSYHLGQNYPNPFNPITTIPLHMPEAGIVNLAVYDVTGREIARLYNGYLNGGNHTFSFSVENIPSGVYFYRVMVNDYLKTRKMTVIK